MRALILLGVLAGLSAVPGLPRAEQTTVTTAASDAGGGVVRVLDKTSGLTIDLDLRQGETGAMGALSVRLDACRYPTDNPSGDAFEHLTIHYRQADPPVFSGWMIASAPALNAMDHTRYDVWALRCSTS